MGRIGNAGRILLEIAEQAGIFLEDIGGFSMGSPRARMKFFNKLTGTDNYNSYYYLEKEGYLEKNDEGKFLITPKGAKRAWLLKVERSKPKKGEKWDGTWKIVIFDIPEKIRAERDAVRSYLKRHGFRKLQNSVFVAPFADFDELNFIRHEYHVEKYVNFLIAKSAGVDDDSLLRKHFNLK